MLEIIKDGSLERLIIVVIIFGGIVVLEVLGKPFDERLFDIAFVAAGFFFHMTVAQIRNGMKG